MGQKERLIPRLFSCAEKYEKNLAENSFLFVAQENKTSGYRFFEVAFGRENFMHLTGCRLLPASGVKGGTGALRFYDLCLEKRLSPNMFQPAGEAHLKLPVLEQAMDLRRFAVSAGEFRDSRLFLKAEQVVGNHVGVLGFRQGTLSPLYSPVTALLGRTDEFVLSEWRVIAIYRKPIGDEKYPYIPYGAMKAYRSGGGDWESYIDTKLLPPP